MTGLTPPPSEVLRHTTLTPACTPCNALMGRTSYSVVAGQTVWEVWTCFGCMTAKEYGQHPLREAQDKPRG